MNVVGRVLAAAAVLGCLRLLWALLDALGGGDYVAAALLTFGLAALGQVSLEWWSWAEGRRGGGSER